MQLVNNLKITWDTVRKTSDIFTTARNTIVTTKIIEV